MCNYRRNNQYPSITVIHFHPAFLPTAACLVNSHQSLQCIFRLATRRTRLKLTPQDIHHKYLLRRQSSLKQKMMLPFGPRLTVETVIEILLAEGTSVGGAVIERLVRGLDNMCGLIHEESADAAKEVLAALEAKIQFNR
jgi:hypothetical protein